MAKGEKHQTGTLHNVSQAAVASANTMVLRVPKPNVQIAVLGLVAFITLFQTFQLIRISEKAGSTSVKVAPAVATTTSTGAKNSSSTNTPQSMVGGC